jgi:hypothetical protein
MPGLAIIRQEKLAVAPLFDDSRYADRPATSIAAFNARAASLSGARVVWGGGDA